MYRPEGWPKSPCIGCSLESKECAFDCAERIEFTCREEGADAILEGLYKACYGKWMRITKAGGDIVIYVDGG